MRIRGRKLYAADLNERRLLQQLGVDSLRVPRSANVYAVARRMSRLARNAEAVVLQARELIASYKVQPPRPGPEMYTEAEPVDAPAAAAPTA